MKLENNLEILKEAMNILMLGDDEAKVVTYEMINNMPMDYHLFEGYVYGQLKCVHTSVYTTKDKLYDEDKINELSDSGLTGSKREKIFAEIKGNVFSNAIIILERLIKDAETDAILRPYFSIGGKR